MLLRSQRVDGTRIFAELLLKGWTKLGVILSLVTTISMQLAASQVLTVMQCFQLRDDVVALASDYSLVHKFP